MAGESLLYLGLMYISTALLCAVLKNIGHIPAHRRTKYSAFMLGSVGCTPAYSVATCVCVWLLKNMDCIAEAVH